MTASESLSQKAGITFYTSTTCPYAQRAWIALKEKGLDFDTQIIDLRNKPDWYFAINPNGKVPSISDNGKIMYESLVILEYLEDAYPDAKPLLPKDPYKKALNRIVVSRADSLITTGFKWLRNEVEEDEPNLQTAFEKELRAVEDLLADDDGPYFGGSVVSLADVALIPFFERLTVCLSAWRHFTIRDNASYPKLSKWLDAMDKLPSYASTRKDPQELLEVYQKYLNVRIFANGATAK